MTPVAQPRPRLDTAPKSMSSAEDLTKAVVLPARSEGTPDAEALTSRPLSPRDIFANLAEITPLIRGYRSDRAFQARLAEALSQGVLVVAEIDSEKLAELDTGNGSGYKVVCELHLHESIRDTYNAQELARRLQTLTKQTVDIREPNVKHEIDATLAIKKDYRGVKHLPPGVVLIDTDGSVNATVASLRASYQYQFPFVVTPNLNVDTGQVDSIVLSFSTSHLERHWDMSSFAHALLGFKPSNRTKSRGYPGPTTVQHADYRDYLAGKERSGKNRFSAESIAARVTSPPRPEIRPETDSARSPAVSRILPPSPRLPGTTSKQHTNGIRKGPSTTDRVEAPTHHPDSVEADNQGDPGELAKYLAAYQRQKALGKVK